MYIHVGGLGAEECGGGGGQGQREAGVPGRLTYADLC